MAYRADPVPTGRPPHWRVWSPQRVDDFSWLIIPQKWFDARDPLLDSVLNLVYGAVLIVEVILIVPTLGPIRLAVHHFRSPGWYVECRFGSALERPTDPRIELRTRTKRQANRMKRALRREFGNGADFNSSAVQAAVARGNASVRPVKSTPVRRGTI